MREKSLEEIKFKIMVKLANIIATDSNSKNSLIKDVNELYKNYMELDNPTIKTERKDFAESAKEVLKKFDITNLNIKVNQF